jgi:Ricin-type beta-trefoil lectin domain
MRRMRLAFAATAASGLVAAGMFTAFSLLAGPANAGEIDSCTGGGTPIGCTLTEVSVTSPQSIELRALTNFDAVDFTWSVTCTLGQAVATKSGSQDSTSVVDTAFASVTLPFVNPDGCYISATATLPGTRSTPPTSTASATPTPTATPTLTLEIDYNAQPGATASATTSASASAVAVAQVRGFDGICVDDTGYGSADRTKIQIWSCNSTDAAQGWTYSGSELKIHGDMCINAKGNGKSGSKLILWSCNGAPNEIWIRSDGEYVLKANGYKLCMDDPAYSTRGGTQLIVYACHNSANQHWSLP